MVTAMTSAVLAYPYQPSERKGVPDAIQIAGQWLQEIFKEPWWPSDSVHHLVHHGNDGTCDAVKITYRARDAAGPLTITVFQTLFLIVVTIGREPGAKLEALSVGQPPFSSLRTFALHAPNARRSGSHGLPGLERSAVPQL